MQSVFQDKSSITQVIDAPFLRLEVTLMILPQKSHPRMVVNRGNSKVVRRRFNFDFTVSHPSCPTSEAMTPLSIGSMMIDRVQTNGERTE